MAMSATLVSTSSSIEPCHHHEGQSHRCPATPRHYVGVKPLHALAMRGPSRNRDRPASLDDSLPHALADLVSLRNQGGLVQRQHLVVAHHELAIDHRRLHV